MMTANDKKARIILPSPRFHFQTKLPHQKAFTPKYKVSQISHCNLISCSQYLSMSMSSLPNTKKKLGVIYKEMKEKVEEIEKQIKQIKAADSLGCVNFSDLCIHADLKFHKV